MAESTLEKIVVKLSCRAFELELDRDHWRNQAHSLEEQLAQSQAALTHTLRQDGERRKRLKEVQTQLHQHQVRHVEVDYQLRAIALAASATEASLPEERKESKFVKDTLHTIQEIVKKNDVRSILFSTRKSSPDRYVPLQSSAYWHESSSESD